MDVATSTLDGTTTKFLIGALGAVAAAFWYLVQMYLKSTEKSAQLSRDVQKETNASLNALALGTKEMAAETRNHIKIAEDVQQLVIKHIVEKKKGE